MKYILNEPWCLRGWKNKQYCLCDFTSPAEPIEITEGDMASLSSPFEYDGGNQTIDRMIDAGMLRPAGERETLDETRQYRNYGCLHFSSVIFSITGKCNYNCLHCSVNAPEAPLGEFSFERIEELLDEMKDCGLKNIVLIVYGLISFIRKLRKYVMLPSWSYHPERAAVTPACRVYRRELNISPDGILSPCYAIMADDYIRSTMPDINKMPLKSG